MTMQDADALVQAYLRTPNGKASEPRRVVVEAAHTIRPEPVRFLWEGRWPLGAVSLVAGEGGLGKSTLCTEQHARLSRGELEGELNGQPAYSLIITSEDHKRSVVIPRLIAANADLERVGVVGVQAEGRSELVTFPDDLPELEERIRETEARLLTVDPVVGALSGQIDSHKDHSIRRVLGPLAQLAERCDISIAGTIHMNKSAVSDLLNRISGSKGFVNAARSVLVFARDPNDVDGDEGYERVIVHGKSNWGRYAPTLAARIEERRLGTEVTGAERDIITSRLVITGESDVTRADISRDSISEGSDKKDLARHWLLVRLADGGWHDSGEIKTEGEGENHKVRTLERAFGGLVNEGAAEYKSEGFPRRTYWRIHSGANTVAPLPTRESGATGKSSSTKPKTPQSDPQSRQTPRLAPLRPYQPKCPGHDRPVEATDDGRCSLCLGWLS
jgi:hypothetical protein